MNLDTLLQYHENNRLELKKAKSSLPISVWETYSAFANCEGGIIALGIREQKESDYQISGIENPEKLLKEFWDTIHNTNKVSANLLMEKDVKIIETEHGSVMFVHVPAAHRSLKPIYINNDMFCGSYRRNFEGDYKCTREDVKAMLRDQPEETMDTKVLDDCSIKDLDRESIKKFRNRHMVYKPSHVWEELDDEAYLERIGAIAYSKIDGLRHPTAAGLLMFGQEYCITREFPEYFLDYREMLDPTLRWSDRLYSTSGDWSGNLYDFFFRVYHKLIHDIKIPFRLDGVTRIDDTPVHKAIREALVNCLINCDYYGRCGIVVKKDATSIVLENPGNVRIGVTQMIKGGMSDPRNKVLMKMFNMINIGERAGSGVPDILHVWEKEGWQLPDIHQQYAPDRTIITLYFEKAPIKSVDKKPPIKSADKLGNHTYEQCTKILEYMKTGAAYTLEEIMRLLGLKETRTKELLRHLAAQGKIQKTGGNKNRRYVKQ